MNEQKTVQQIIDRSQHTFVMDGAGKAYSSVKVKIDDLRALEAKLLALQTQLAAAELKAKEWIDVAYEAASQKEELKRELERVERETRETERERCKQALLSAIAYQKGICCDNCNCQAMKRGLEAIEFPLVLPSAKTATETE